MKSRQDWIDAGKQVFESALDPTPVDDLPFTDVRRRAWYDEPKPRCRWERTAHSPLFAPSFLRYVIRKRGQVEVTMDSCASCHTRVLMDGTIVPGAQGSIAFGKLFAYQLNHIPVVARVVSWFKPAPVKPLLV